MVELELKHRPDARLDRLPTPDPKRNPLRYIKAQRVPVVISDDDGNPVHCALLTPGKNTMSADLWDAIKDDPTVADLMKRELLVMVDAGTPAEKPASRRRRSAPAEESKED